MAHNCGSPSPTRNNDRFCQSEVSTETARFMSSSADPQLQLTPHEMRKLGYQVIDTLVAHFETLSEQPVSNTATPETMRRLLDEPAPEHGTAWKKVVERVTRDVLENAMRVDHPRFLAFVPSPSNFVSAMADALASGMNVFAGTWMEAAGPAQVELTTIDWLRAMCGLPETAGGLFVSGGSMANITALAVARHIRLDGENRDGVVYMSDQAHSSIARGLRVLGFTPDQVVSLPSDDDCRLSVYALVEHIRVDRTEGKTPFCVVANAGTTNTGAIDPLRELADVCRREALWLHADGAYGASAACTERGRDALDGLDLVDSLSIDPHKWLFQPYECAAVFVRDREHMRETFHVMPEYLKDLEATTDEVNFYDYGIQLTRGFRALKLWMSIQVFGMAAFRVAVERGFELAEYAERLLASRANWEVMSPAQMGILTFRYHPEQGDVDDFNRQLVEPITADGFALVMTTSVKGNTVLRFCTINPRTTEDDIEETIERMETYALSMV